MFVEWVSKYVVLPRHQPSMHYQRDQIVCFIFPFFEKGRGGGCGGYD